MNFNDPQNETTSPLGATGAESDGQDFDDFTDGEGDGALDALSGASAGRKINSGVLVVLLVVGVAIISLFAMRSLSRASAGGLTMSEIEQMVDDFVKERGTTRGSVSGDAGTLQMLDHDYSDRQVPLSEVQKNPFILDETQGATADANTGDPDDSDAMVREYQRQREARQQAISAAANTLQLQAILMGSTPVANLGGTYVRVGESLELEEQRIEFFVTDITHNTVSLIGKDPRFDAEVELTLYLRKP